MLVRTVVAFATLSAGVAQAAPADSPVVAVFGVEDASRTLSPEAVEQLSTYLTARMAVGGRFQVVPRAQLRQALTEQKQASYQACFDESCQIEIGRELAAQKTLHTQVIKLGDNCAVTSTLFDLTRAASEQAATAKSACSPEALGSAIESVAAQLTGTAGTPLTADSDTQVPDRADALETGGDQVLVTVAPSHRTRWIELSPGVSATLGGSFLVGAGTKLFSLRFGSLRWSILDASFGFGKGSVTPSSATDSYPSQVTHWSVGTHLGIELDLGAEAHRTLQFGLGVGLFHASEAADDTILTLLDSSTEDATTKVPIGFWPTVQYTHTSDDGWSWGLSLQLVIAPVADSGREGRGLPHTIIIGIPLAYAGGA